MHEVAQVLTQLGVGGLAGLMGAILLWRRFPREARKLDAQRDEILQDLGRKNAAAASHVVDMVKDEIEELRAERSALRDRALAAEAAAAGAQLAQAQATAELATERALRSQERHHLRDELAARDVKIRLLEEQLGDLQDEVALLRTSTLERRRGPR